MYLNFKIKSGVGLFYISSKEPFDGAVLTNTKFGDFYHKTFEHVSGTLVGAVLDTPEWGGSERIKIFLENGDDTHVLETNLVDENDNVESWAKEFAKFLPSINLGDKLEFSLNRKKKAPEEKGGRLYKNLYVNRDGDKVEWAFERTEIPPPETTTKRGGKPTLNFQKQDDWYYDLIKKQVERLALQREAAAQATQATQGAQVPSGQEDDDIDSLPF